MKTRSAELGRQLKRYRKIAKMTQAHVAEYMGFARTTIVAIEQGQRGVSDMLLETFARLYGVTVETLKNPPPENDTITRYENLFLQLVLKGVISEGLAAQWMQTHIVDIRHRMIERYGEDWRDANNNQVDMMQRMVNAGDMDDVLDIVHWSRKEALRKAPSVFSEMRDA